MWQWYDLMNKQIIGAVAVVILIVAAISVWQITSLQTQIANSQAQNNDLKSQNGELQNQTTWLQDQNKELQDQISKLEQPGGNYNHPVKIIAFEWLGGWFPMGGVTLYNPVNVTIRNDEIVTVSGLSMDVKLIDKYSGNQIGTSGGTNQIDPLQPGEVRTVGVGAYTSVGTSLDNAACVVSLKSGSTLLDEWTRSIS